MKRLLLSIQRKFNTGERRRRGQSAITLKPKIPKVQIKKKKRAVKCHS